jgi:hypothetical protein
MEFWRVDFFKTRALVSVNVHGRLHEIRQAGAITDGKKQPDPFQ